MAHEEHQLTVGDRGRIALPSAVRSKLGLERGTGLLGERWCLLPGPKCPLTVIGR